MLYGYGETVLDQLHLNPGCCGIVGRRNGKSLLDYGWSSMTGHTSQSRERPHGAHGLTRLHLLRLA